MSQDARKFETELDQVLADAVVAWIDDLDLEGKREAALSVMAEYRMLLPRSRRLDEAEKLQPFSLAQ